MTADEFLIKWRKENNTPLATYSSYHIDAMEAYHKQEVEAISDEAFKIVKDLSDWSKKYPRQKIYGYSSKEDMDNELIQLEERANKLLKQ